MLRFFFFSRINPNHVPIDEDIKQTSELGKCNLQAFFVFIVKAGVSVYVAYTAHNGVLSPFFVVVFLLRYIEIKTKSGELQDNFAVSGSADSKSMECKSHLSELSTLLLLKIPAWYVF